MITPPQCIVHCFKHTIGSQRESFARGICMIDDRMCREWEKLKNLGQFPPYCTLCLCLQRCKACHNPFLNKCLKNKSCLLEERNLCSFQCMSRSCPDPMCYPRGRHDHVRHKNNWGKKSSITCGHDHVLIPCVFHAVWSYSIMHCVLWTWEIGQYFVLYIVLSTAMPGDNSFLHRWLLFQIRRLVLCDTWTCERHTEFRSALSF